MKDYRRIKFSYNTDVLEIDVPLRSERVTREEVSGEVQAIDGSRYKIITGYSNKYSYSFGACLAEIVNFFISAYENSTTYDIIMSREQDDGTFKNETVIIQAPQYQDDVIGTDGDKVYNNVRIEILTA